MLSPQTMNSLSKRVPWCFSESRNLRVMNQDMERLYFHSQTQSCFSQSKYDTRQPHYFNVTIKQQQKQRIPQELASKGCLESVPSKTGINTNVKETHVYYNSKKLYYNNQKKCLSSKQQNALKKKKKKTLIIKFSGFLNLQAQLLVGSIHKAAGWAVFFLLYNRRLVPRVCTNSPWVRRTRPRRVEI